MARSILNEKQEPARPKGGSLPPATMRFPLPSQRWKYLQVAAWLTGVLPLVIVRPATASESVRFERDVMAVLSKAGCNLGACHGNLNGKGGFKLSLRGEDPAADYASLLRQVDQRRVNLMEPEASLILQKPTGQVVHQGGLRFNRDFGAKTLRSPHPPGRSRRDGSPTPWSSYTAGDWSGRTRGRVGIGISFG